MKTVKLENIVTGGDFIKIQSVSRPQLRRSGSFYSIQTILKMKDKIKITLHKITRKLDFFTVTYTLKAFFIESNNYMYLY